ncbi:MAG: GNAT family N-acetyltransferase [Burkholderiales bacterium]
MRPAVFGAPPMALVAVTEPELAAVNALIERAIAGWRLPERVRRLMLPSYCYRAADLTCLDLVAARVHGAIVGVAAWEDAPPGEPPAGARGLLLHGLYVDPPWQGRGLGRTLFEAACEAARRKGFEGVLVRARPEAAGFFAAMGGQALPVVDPARDYPHRFWKTV